MNLKNICNVSTIPLPVPLSKLTKIFIDKTSIPIQSERKGKMKIKKYIDFVILKLNTIQ